MKEEKSREINGCVLGDEASLRKSSLSHWWIELEVPTEGWPSRGRFTWSLELYLLWKWYHF